MRYQIVLQYADPAISERVSTVERDSDEEARDAARRWARLVCNASGPHHPRPVIWWVNRLGLDDVFHPIAAHPITPSQRS